MDFLAILTKTYRFSQKHIEKSGFGHLQPKALETQKYILFFLHSQLFREI